MLALTILRTLRSHTSTPARLGYQPLWCQSRYRSEFFTSPSCTHSCTHSSACTGGPRSHLLSIDLYRFWSPKHCPKPVHNPTPSVLPIANRLEVYKEMKQAVPKCIDAIRQCKADAAACGVETEKKCVQPLISPVRSTGVNVYDLRRWAASSKLPQPEP